VQFDFYGQRMAACSVDGFISIYDLANTENPKQVASFKA